MRPRSRPSPAGAGVDECSTLHESTEDYGRRAPASRSAEGASERLCRYVTRPPLAQDRLELRPDGKLELTLKKVWKDGPRALVLEPRDFIIRLIAAIPPPRLHLVRYLGVLSSHSKFRSEVVPKPPQDSAASKPPPASGDQLEFPKANPQTDDARPSRKRRLTPSRPVATPQAFPLRSRSPQSSSFRLSRSSRPTSRTALPASRRHFANYQETNVVRRVQSVVWHFECLMLRRTRDKTAEVPGRLIVLPCGPTGCLARRRLGGQATCPRRWKTNHSPSPKAFNRGTRCQ